MLSARGSRLGVLTATGVSLAVNLGNLGAYIFQVGLSHSLSKTEYAHFNVLFAIVLILLTPTPVIALIIVHLHRSQQTLHRGLSDAVGMLFTLLSALAALFLLFVLIISDFFSLGLCFGASLLFFFSALQMVATGMQQSARRHVHVALAQASVGLVRAALIGLFMGAGVSVGVADAVWICVLAAGVGCILLVPLRLPQAYVRYLRDVYVSLDGGCTDLYKTIAPLFFGYARLMLVFAFLQNIDLLIVYLRWPGSAAGDYAGASVLARIGFLIPSSLFTLTFAEIVLSRGAASAGENHLARISFLMVILASVGAVIFFLIFAEPLLVYFFNSDYASATGMTRRLGAAMALMALLQAIIFKLYAHDEASLLSPLAFIFVAFLVGAAGFARSPEDVALFLLLTTFLSVANYGRRLMMR
jgi:O-antigen/teichoic acid export membrane protein